MSSITITASLGPLHATVRVPGSKSVANRALVCAMLAEGESIISNLPSGDDTQVIVDVLVNMNAAVEIQPSTFAVRGDSNRSLPGIVDAQLAGTSSRFLTAVAALSTQTVIIDGAQPLRERPMRELHEALTHLGADITPLGDIGHLPVSVSRGQLHGGHLAIKGDVSSQFISALMLIAPLLPNGLRIEIDGPLVSRSYVLMTMQVMKAFGAVVDYQDSEITIESTGYQAQNYVVEPDFSSAAFPLSAVAIRGGEVTVPFLATSNMQGDSEMLAILGEMGVEIVVNGDDVVAWHPEGEHLFPITKNMADCSDLVPAVALVCAVANGVSELTGIGFIRNKESDRIGDLSGELTKCGAIVEELPDGLRITGVTQLQTATFATHHDHRLAMALALSSLRADSCVIEEAQVVSKSWPSYFEDMREILGSVSKDK